MNVPKFKGILAEAGVSQRELAKRIGISENTMSDRMTGKSSFRTDEIERICKELQINNTEQKALIFLSESSQNRDETKLGLRKTKSA